MITALYVFLSVVALALGLFIIVRPIFSYIVKYAEASQNPRIKGNLFAFTLLLLFISAWSTALLGVDAIFGAFLFGLIVPVSIKCMKTEFIILYRDEYIRVHCRQL